MQLNLFIKELTIKSDSYILYKCLVRLYQLNTAAKGNKCCWDQKLKFLFANIIVIRGNYFYNKIMLIFDSFSMFLS